MARPAGQPLAGTQEPWSEAILACDFFTAELLDGTQAYVLAVIEHASRRIRILGVTLHPTGERTSAPVRNPPQSAPAAPVTELRCAAETATRIG